MLLAASEGAALVVEPGDIDTRTINAFSNGQCAGMAIALHRRTGWALVLRLVGGVPQHVLVRDANDRLVDVRGIRDPTELAAGAVLTDVDEDAVRDLCLSHRWAEPDAKAADLWVDQVIGLVESGRTLDGETYRRTWDIDGRTGDVTLEVTWTGAPFLELAVRPVGSGGPWRAIAALPLPLDPVTGLRVIDFTIDAFGTLSETWLQQAWQRPSWL